MNLAVVPISLFEANAFVEAHHRHHEPVVGHKFSIAVADGDQVRGVAIVGRPVARGCDDGWTLEVARCCTDGAKKCLLHAVRRQLACCKSDGLSPPDHLHAAQRRRREPSGRWMEVDRPARRRELEHASSASYRHRRHSTGPKNLWEAA